MRIFLASFIIVYSTLLKAQHQAYFPDPEPGIRERLEAWQDLKFGLLMHWGPYSQWGIVESWSICPEDLSWATGGRKKGVSDTYKGYVEAYEKLPLTFNPTRFEPEKWAAAARDAGMKYVVFTTKHHDGFCMFDTKLTDYRITDKNCPFNAHPRANIAREIFDAFRKEGFWTGAYFSKPDWHCDAYWWRKFPAVDRNCNYSISKHPEQWQRYVDFTHGQIEELMSDYGKMDILWLDGGWVCKKTPEEVKNEMFAEYENSRWARNPQSQDVDMPGLVKKARAKQPGLIVVDRAVPGIHQNYLTPEQHIPETGLPYPWETCMTMAGSWSYVPGDRYKPADELIEKLTDIVSKGGNYLLNIGPSPEGEFDPAAYERLREIGGWLKKNGEAIYGTRMYDVFGEGDKVRYTRSKDAKTVYIHLFDYPSGPLELARLPWAEGARLELLENGQSVDWKKTANGVVLNLPPKKDDSEGYVWVLKLKLR